MARTVAGWLLVCRQPIGSGWSSRANRRWAARQEPHWGAAANASSRRAAGVIAQA